MFSNDANDEYIAFTIYRDTKRSSLGVTWAMSQLPAFVANQVLREYALFYMFYPDFYSDIEDFTQILCRYLPKKLADGTSALGHHNIIWIF